MAPGDQVMPPVEPDQPGNAIICFAKGTMIRTPHGERRVEHLEYGDLVLTKDHGPQPIRWAGSKTVRASGALAPVSIARGTIGNDRDLLVSPQHRLLIAGAATRRTGTAGEVLAPALALVDGYRISVAYGGMVSYHHLMFDQHEVVIANGAPSESFHPGGIGLDTLDAAAREGLFAKFPELRTGANSYSQPVRPCLSMSKAKLLAFG